MAGNHPAIKLCKENPLMSGENIILLEEVVVLLLLIASVEVEQQLPRAG